MKKKLVLGLMLGLMISIRALAGHGAGGSGTGTPDGGPVEPRLPTTQVETLADRGGEQIGPKMSPA